IRAGGLTQSTGGTMGLAPGAWAKPRTAGIRMLSAGTAVPSATLGTRLGGGAVPFLTHSSSARKSARNAGVALCGLRGLTQGPGLGSVRTAAMLGPGDHINPRSGRQFGIVLAGWVGVHQRGALLPVLGRSVGLDHLGLS